MEPFQYHVFICDQQKPEGVPCCSVRCSASVIEVLRREIAMQGLTDAVQLTVCGSLGLCEHGPNMVVYPEGIWYSGITAEDVPEIARSHFGDGNVVERLARFDTQDLRAEILSNREKMQAALRAKEAAGVFPDDLLQTVRSFQDSRVILTAIELDLFSAVGSGTSARETATKMECEPRATEMLLNALCALKLLRKDGGVFHNTPVSSRYFVAGSPDYSRDAMMHTVHLWRTWSTLTECVKTGTSLSSAASSDREEDWTGAFIAAMDRISRERAPLVVRAVGVEGRKRMLDVGGGSAAYSIAFCKANPDLEAEVFDLPSVVTLARRYIDSAGLTDRIRTRAGNLESDSLGDGFDLVLVSQICHSLSEQGNLDLLRKCRGAMLPGGTLVIQEFILDANKAGPKFAALFALNMLVGTRSGAAYSEDELMSWLGQTGFEDMRRIRLPGPSGLILAKRR